MAQGIIDLTDDADERAGAVVDGVRSARLGHFLAPAATRAHAWAVRFQHLMQQIAAVPYEFDGEAGRFVFVGEGAAALCGHTPDAWYGERYWPECIHPEDRERVTTAYGSLASAPADLVYRLQTASGATVWVQDRGYPLVVGGAPRGRMGFLGFAHGGDRLAAADASVDPLTGVLDRSAFLERCAQFLDEIARRALCAAMIVLDLDEFNAINETFGTACGDGVLQEVARRLGRCARIDGLVGRTGADEFVLLLSVPESDGVMQRLLTEIHASVTSRVEIGKAEIYPRASLGVSLYPADARTPELLVEHAAASLGEARRKGGGGAEFYSRAVNSRMAQRIRLETRLHHALAREEFVLHFQPQVDLEAGVAVGMEALLRWQDPQHGLLMPAAFVPTLEESGLMLQAGEWILHAALKTVAGLQEAGLQPVPVAVNVTARQLAEPGLVGCIERALELFGVAPELLELEITESAWVDRDRATRERLHRLREMGVGLAIDDFGTGYSSLAYLRDLPVSTIKIDQIFIRGLPHYRRDRGIVEAIHTLARHLDLRVVAEGVESRAQLNCVAELGSDAAQGFFFSRAVPEHELPDRLVRGYRLA